MSSKRRSTGQPNSPFRQSLVKASFWLGVVITFLITPQLFSVAGGMANGAFGASVAHDEVIGFQVILFLMLCMLSLSVIAAGATTLTMTLSMFVITRLPFFSDKREGK